MLFHDPDRQIYALETLVSEHAMWSRATFGEDHERGPVGGLRHLSKEALEAAEAPNNIVEYVDCFFLFVDAMRRAGFTLDDLLKAGSEKLQVLKTRTYPRTPEGVPSEHIRGGGSSK